MHGVKDFLLFPGIRPDSKPQWRSFSWKTGKQKTGKSPLMNDHPFTRRAETRVQREWQRRGLFAWLLLPCAMLFGFVTMLRRIAYAHGWLKAVRVRAPVVVVGNVTVGGTGKTPTVIAFVEALRAAGFSPGVVSRGYGATHATRTTRAHPTPVMPDTPAAVAGDEPLLIARRTRAPVWVSPDRVAAAQALCNTHPDVDVIVSDDGLQHYRLARDVELVVFDHRLGGNGFLLPAGPLREPLSRQRDATLVNNPFSPALPPWPHTFALQLAPGDAWHLQNPALRRPLAQFANQNQRVLAAAGIGAPERFFATLRAAGLAPHTLALPDHYAFAVNPFADVIADAILVTEKDAVKLNALHDARLWVVPVEAALDHRLVTLVVEKLRGRSSA